MRQLLITALALAYLLVLASCGSTSIVSDNAAIIGTFNIAWLGDGDQDKNPRTDAEYLMVADIIAKTNVDVLAVEEVENQAALQKVLRYLDDYEGVVGNGSGKQRVGVVYRKGVNVKVVGEYLPLQLDRPDRLRPGLIVECSKGAFSWIQLCVHLKSTSRYDSTPAMMDESRAWRTRQAQVIRHFADSVIADGKETDVIVTGDFNDFPGRRNNPTLEALTSCTMKFLNADMRSCANPKWTTIDHVLASPTAAARMIPGSARMENMHDYLSTADASRVSDHCPVIVAFSCTP